MAKSLSKAKLDMLRRLVKPQTAIDLVTPENIRMVQDLVTIGYARDFAAHRGHRVEVRLRIWGITEAGKAVLEQHAIVETANRQPALIFMQKKPLDVPYDRQKWYKASENKFVLRRDIAEKKLKEAEKKETKKEPKKKEEDQGTLI